MNWLGTELFSLLLIIISEEEENKRWLSFLKKIIAQRKTQPTILVTTLELGHVG